MALFSYFYNNYFIGIDLQALGRFLLYINFLWVFLYTKIRQKMMGGQASTWFNSQPHLNYVINIHYRPFVPMYISLLLYLLINGTYTRVNGAKG